MSLVAKALGLALDAFPSEVLEEVADVLDHEQLGAGLLDAAHVLLPQPVSLVALCGGVPVGLLAQAAEALTRWAADDDVSLGKVSIWRMSPQTT